MSKASELIKLCEADVSRIETSGVLKDALMKMRKAIDDGNAARQKGDMSGYKKAQKEEEKYRKELRKAAEKVAKPHLKSAFSEMKKYAKDLEKKLNKETGGKWEIFWSGTPAPTAQSRDVMARSELVMRADFLPE